MEDHDLHLPSMQTHLSQDATLTTRLSAFYIFILVFCNHATLQERIQDKAIQKTNKQKTSQVSLPHRNVTLDICAELCAQAIKSLRAPHKIRKVYVKGH